MSDAPDPSGSILFDFADQLLGDLEAGRLRPLAHYLSRFPGHEEAIAREYLDLTRAPTATSARVRPGGRLERIGPYVLGQILGRGGQGVVYRAVDTRLDRTVALKVLTLPVASVSQGRRTRFRREAEILARLDHPGICAVLDADLDGEMPYIAMRFVEGETLASALIRAREARERADSPATRGDTATSASRLLAPRRALELSETLAFFERAARALHAAHEAGVVHRDVKPGNIVVSTDGSPVLLDFGLARDSEDESAPLTRSDEVFGTPAYISPEQLGGGRHVDRRTDIYSLGVVLYEVLTLERPFQGETSAALSEAIRLAPLPPPRRSNPAIPVDLAVVLETALDKDVERRYPTALEFAEELRRVREYEPIRARPAGPALRLARWARRNPALATGTIGSIAALSIALLVALVLLERVRTEERRKEAALALYEGGWFRDEATGSISDAPPRALELAILAAERDPGLASNRVLLAALNALRERQVLAGHSDFVYDAAVDPAATRVATASADGTVRLWDVASGREIQSRDLGAPVLAVRFTLDGERIVAGCAGGRVAAFEAEGEDARFVEFRGHAKDVHSIQISPDGARALTASRDGTARVFDTHTGALLATCTAAAALAEARFVPGRDLVLARSSEPVLGAAVPEHDGSELLFDARTGRLVAALGGAPGMPTSIDASPDGRFVAAACDDRNACVWDVDRPDAPLHVLAAPGRYHAARFSPDGRSLALTWDAGARVVDAETGADRYVLPSHGRRAVVRAAWRPDGEELATLAYDDALRVFRASDGALVRTCRGSMRQAIGLAWSSDGAFLVSWHRQRTASLWYGADRPFLPVLRGHAGPVRSARFSADGTRVVTASEDGTARVWSAPHARPLGVLDPASLGRARTALVHAEADAGFRRVVTTDTRGGVRVWHVPDATIEREFPGDFEEAVLARLSPDGARVAFAAAGGIVRVVDLATGAEHPVAAHAGEVTTLGFAPDGACLVSGGTDRRVARIDLAPERAPTVAWRTEPFEVELRSQTHVFDVGFSPDGRHVASAPQGAHVDVFDARSGARVARSPRMPTPGRVAFARGAPLLVGTSKYGRTTLLLGFPPAAGDALAFRGRTGHPGEHHTNSTTSLAVARLVPLGVTGSLDRTAHLWNLLDARCTAAYSGHEDAVFDVDVTADGAWVLTASADGTARLWPGDLLAAARSARAPGFAAVIGPVPRPARGD